MINTKKAIDQLFVSRVRVKLLHYFMTHPDIPVHLRGAVRELKEEINAVRRELNRMEEIKLLRTDLRGNRKYFMLNKEGPFVEELKAIVLKTFGLGGQIVRNLNKIGDVKFAILTSAYYSGTATAVNVTGQISSKPVDLVIIGDVNLEELDKLIGEIETKEQREVNYTVFKLSEFELRKKRRDAFIMGLLVGAKVMLVGTQEELIS